MINVSTVTEVFTYKQLVLLMWSKMRQTIQQSKSHNNCPD